MKNQYRIPVCYLCCEEGRTCGYKYTRANSLQEAKSDFRDYFSEDDIEEWPDYDGIEVYDDETEEWL